MTPKQKMVLKMVCEGQIKGICERYVWRFTDGHTNYKAQVRALEAMGLVHISYFSGGEAAVNPVHREG